MRLTRGYGARLHSHPERSGISNQVNIQSRLTGQNRSQPLDTAPLTVPFHRSPAPPVEGGVLDLGSHDLHSLHNLPAFGS